MYSPNSDIDSDDEPLWSPESDEEPEDDDLIKTKPKTKRMDPFLQKVTTIDVRCHQEECTQRPNYAHYGDAGMDLYSSVDETIKPGHHMIIPTGFSIEIPQGYYGRLAGKSGLASRHGIMINAGVIDSGYRGEIKAIVMNLGKEAFQVRKGHKIAQMIVTPYVQALFKFGVQMKMGGSDRGSNGFGSTGSTSLPQPINRVHSSRH